LRASFRGLILGVAIVGALSVVPATTRGVVHAAIPSDFDGDGYADLAIGVQSEDIGTKAGAGAVNVLYGSPAGLSATGNEFWSQDSPGIKGRSQGGRFAADNFGAALASGDFDRDGHADLAIGVRADRVGKDDVRGGAVNVLYGSSHGLTADGDQLWSLANLPGVPARGDSFGVALASGDLNADGYWDLAIGVPGRDLATAPDAGEVVVLRGGPHGLTATGSRTLTRASAGAAGSSAGFRFGSALAAGDVNGDGRADLAVGAPIESRGGAAMFLGAPTGVTTAGSQWWTQASPGIDDVVDGGDRFGAALAIADFDDDGHGDLAIGTPNIVIDAAVGKVIVLPGTSTGPTASGHQVWDSPVEGTDDWGPEFGFALASGDFDGDGAHDLAIGAPWTGSRRGSVYVLYGGSSGLDAAGAQLWSQDSAGVPGTSEDDDVFGIAVAALDVDRSGQADLAIGASGESAHRAAAGRVSVIPGRAGGLSSAGIRAWSQDSPGVKDSEEREDHFGSSLAGSSSRYGW
jgi:hypothetical protein